MIMLNEFWMTIFEFQAEVGLIQKEKITKKIVIFIVE